MTARDVAAVPRPFVPLVELPGADLDPGPLETPEFGARVRAALEARRRQGMKVVVLGEDGRIVRIASDGMETDVAVELDREVARAREWLGRTS